MLGQSVVVSLDTSLTSSSLRDTPMLSQKAKKDYLLDSHFRRSFAFSLVAIAMLTLALPLLIPANKVAPDRMSESTTSVRSVTK
jgi:uncharacterized membrane protein